MEQYADSLKIFGSILLLFGGIFVWFSGDSIYNEIGFSTAMTGAVLLGLGLIKSKY